MCNDPESEDYDVTQSEMYKRFHNEWKSGINGNGRVVQNRERMRQIAKECLAYGLPNDDDWIDKREEIAGRFVDELEMDDAMSGDCADDLMIKFGSY
jgi:hypothetical protein